LAAAAIMEDDWSSPEYRSAVSLRIPSLAFIIDTTFALPLPGFTPLAAAFATSAPMTLLVS